MLALVVVAKARYASASGSRSQIQVGREQGAAEIEIEIMMIGHRMAEYIVGIKSVAYAYGHERQIGTDIAENVRHHVDPELVREQQRIVFGPVVAL